MMKTQLESLLRQRLQTQTGQDGRPAFSLSLTYLNQPTTGNSMLRTRGEFYWYDYDRLYIVCTGRVLNMNIPLVMQHVVSESTLYVYLRMSGGGGPKLKKRKFFVKKKDRKGPPLCTM